MCIYVVKVDGEKDLNLSGDSSSDAPMISSSMSHTWMPKPSNSQREHATCDAQHATGRRAPAWVDDLAEYIAGGRMHGWAPKGTQGT